MTEPTAQQAVHGRAAGQSRDTPQKPWRAAASLAPAGTDVAGWPSERRVAALARLDESGLPDGADEDWRYTSLAGYGQRWSAYLAAAGLAARPAGIDTRADGSAFSTAGAGHPGTSGSPGTVHAQIVDGILQAPPGAMPRGLYIGSLRQLTPELRARAADLLRKSGDVAPETLVDLNSALLADVILVTTETGASLEAMPLHILIQGSGAPAFSQPRILVDVAQDSRFTLILEHGGAAGTLCNAVTQAWVGSGAHLNLVRVQLLPDDGMLTETSRIELAAAASTHITSMDLGAQLSRHALTVLLAGAGASASVDGLFLADGNRHVDNHTRLEHLAPGTTSRESFRGLADGHGRGVFNGKIIVREGAAGSNAALTNRNLLLAATAEIDTKPELEIYVDDVRCSHGATTGQLDANALFYLRSRGLDPAAARQVLTAAFLREPLGGIAQPELRARLEARLEEKLGGNAAIAGPGAGS
ncbi:MAG: Fe-S cluster assembly protein SufD [Gammaproteobacteria bacterium]